MMKIRQLGITPQQLQRNLSGAARILSGEAGFPAAAQEALIQLHRFTVANIEVDTARTKNSIFMSNGVEAGGGWWGALASNVAYSPYVRDAQHNMHFFENARRKEGPRVLSALGREITLAVHDAIGD